ncbi:uncharacterized protein E0L32_000710 [Thyridium curvatum]|uniref:Uncharacterized protein n=1 Tax=Thyridium curvatum TaxID=1093900 RepID=A0A507AY23_9PEZI|nr:uncharacterized protein E0L32_000710 [Thyridium curvatum]TPX12533.1 hypothetical protein E0L32_000710 [Thyridium curvatum]
MDDKHLGNNFTTTIHQDTYPLIQSTKCDHRGRNVFITGASKGIGREMALSFAKAGAANVAVAARSEFGNIRDEIEQAAKSASRPVPNVLVLKLDVTDGRSVQHAASEFEKHCGHLDILVNNAGIVESPFQLIGDIDPAVWWTTMDVNLRGVYLMTRAFLPLLLRGDTKIIVNVGSVAQNYITPGASAYGVSKLALARFTEFIDAEYGKQGITAITIHPGAILTNLGRRLPDYMAENGWMTETEYLPADTVVFLTQQKRPWLSGRYISATWDMEELMQKEDEIVQGNLLKLRMLV